MKTTLALLLFMLIGTLAMVSSAGPICPGERTGYLCDASTKKQYYECNSPWFVGWRDCPSGTVCTDTSRLHSEIPCYVYEDDTPDTGRASDYRGGEHAGDDVDGAASAVRNWEAQVGAVDSWRTWWLWVALGGYAFVAVIVGWIGCVTWPSTHKRLALATNRCIC